MHIQAHPHHSVVELKDTQVIAYPDGYQRILGEMLAEAIYRNHRVKVFYLEDKKVRVLHWNPLLVTVDDNGIATEI